MIHHHSAGQTLQKKLLKNQYTEVAHMNCGEKLLIMNQNTFVKMFMILMVRHISGRMVDAAVAIENEKRRRRRETTYYFLRQ